MQWMVACRPRQLLTSSQEVVVRRHGDNATPNCRRRVVMRCAKYRDAVIPQYEWG